MCTFVPNTMQITIKIKLTIYNQIYIKTISMRFKAFKFHTMKFQSIFQKGP